MVGFCRKYLAVTNFHLPGRGNPNLVAKMGEEAHLESPGEQSRLSCLSQHPLLWRAGNPSLELGLWGESDWRAVYFAASRR